MIDRRTKPDPVGRGWRILRQSVLMASRRLIFSARNPRHHPQPIRRTGNGGEPTCELLSDPHIDNPMRMQICSKLLSLYAVSLVPLSAAVGGGVDVIAGPVVNQGNGHTYYLLAPSNWSAAEAKAVNLGGHLVTVNDATENDWLVTNFGIHQGSARTLWTGLNDLVVLGSYVWSSGSPAVFRNWASSEPTTGDARRHALLIGSEATDAARGKWHAARNDGTETLAHGVVEIPPVIRNVIAVPRLGTTLVDIGYDVSDTTRPLDIAVDIAGSDGSLRRIPSSGLRGAIGDNVVPGSNLRIVWDTGVPGAGGYAATDCVMVVANESPLPAGFVLVPAGDVELELRTDQFNAGPKRSFRRAYVSAFFISRYEISNEIFERVWKWGESHGYSMFPQGKGLNGLRKSAIHPVTSVSWDAAVCWCNARSEMEELKPCYTVSGEVLRSDSIGDGEVFCDWKANGYRLPTEAEWEKAARGGLVGKMFPWGDTISQKQANYLCDNASFCHSFPELTAWDINENRGYHPDYLAGGEPYTSPVGSFPPNGFGLYDMAGNAGEWCWDWHDEYRTENEPDPRGPPTGSTRVFRGGGWSLSGYQQSCGWRGSLNPSIPYLDQRQGIGFRVVRGWL